MTASTAALRMDGARHAFSEAPLSRRTLAAGAAIATTALLGLILLLGLRVFTAERLAPEPGPATFDVPAVAPPAPTRPVRAPVIAAAAPRAATAPAAPAPSGAPAPAPPTATIVPSAEVSVPVAEFSGSGVGVSAPDATGSGLGEVGTGRGGGDGAGGGGGLIAQRARQVDGFITLADYPAAARRTGAQGTTHIRYTVKPDGRADACEVVRSSGHSLLDQVTCRLAVRRFVFRPALDRAGQKVTETRTDRFAWRVTD